MVYGYARVSTEEQSVDGQVAELKALGCDKVSVEKASGKSRKKAAAGKVIGKFNAWRCNIGCENR